MSNLYITHNSYGPRTNCERSFSALRGDAFGILASLCSQSLVYTLWFKFCSQIIVVEHMLTWIQCFIKSCLLKKSPIHISVNRILLWILFYSIIYLLNHISKWNNDVHSISARVIITSCEVGNIINIYLYIYTYLYIC